MQRDKLIRMANQIATFFASQPRDVAVAGVAQHLNEFWDPRMRRAFHAMIAEGGDGLLPLVIEAAPQVKAPADAA